MFPFEKFVTKLKENLHVLLKDKSKALTETQMVNKMLPGICSTDASIASAKVNVYQTAAQTLIGLWSSCRSNVEQTRRGATGSCQSTFRKQASILKRNGSNDQRGGRGRARRGGGRIGQHSGRSSGRG